MADQKQQLSILRHTLGVGEGGWEKSHRNHFVAGAGGQNHAVCMELVNHGLMTRQQGHPLAGGDDVFYATDIGRAAAIAQAPTTTREQRRYRAYLASDSRQSFIEWLRSSSARKATNG